MNNPQDLSKLAAQWPIGEVQTPYSKLKIIIRGISATVELDGTESSCLDMLNPKNLEFEYQQQLDLLLRAQLEATQSLRALHLGGCACALARAWDDYYQKSVQVAVELDPYLVENVRAWFSLPSSPRLRIRQGEAWEVLQSLRDSSWPVIVKDVFAKGQVPENLSSLQYAQEICRVLDKQRAPGLYLANLAAKAPATQSRALAQMEIENLRESGMKHFVALADPKVWRGQRIGNIVLAGSFKELNLAEINRQARRLALPTGVFEDF